MARTLIIKNADFSVNKVTTVNIEEEVPCTGISLNNNTLSITHIGDTATLVATATPADTTDAIIWSTSDADVATVAGGVVTAVGCGTATITAVCGEFSASCTVTVVHIATWNNLAYTLNHYINKGANNDYLNGSELDKYAQVYSTDVATGLLYLGATGKYPYVIPKGANNVVIDGTGINSRCFWMSSTLTGSGGARAKCYDATSYTANPNTVAIPSRTTEGYTGFDAVAICLSKSTSFVESDMSDVTITFSA